MVNLYKKELIELNVVYYGKNLSSILLHDNHENCVICNNVSKNDHFHFIDWNSMCVSHQYYLSHKLENIVTELEVK